MSRARMPSPMNGSGYNTPDLHKDDLSDEAIELLYTIIHRASSSPDRSSRALFNAYEEVLEEHGLLPSDDAVLHRFLFRMQKDRRRGESLVERFHRVLAEFEIVIEAEEESEGDIDFATGSFAHGGITANARSAARAALGHTDRFTRRGSFESFFDGTADKVAGSDIREVSKGKRSSSLSQAQERILPKRRSTSNTEALRLQQVQLPIRMQVNGGVQRRGSSGQYYGRQRNASISSRGSLRIRRDANTEASQRKDYGEAASEYTDRTTDLDLSRVQVPGVNAPIPDDQYERRDAHESTHYYQQFVPEPYQPSDTRLMDEAETFEHQRLHRVTRGCIQAWRNRTRDILERRYEQEALAEAFDRKILLKVTLDQLRETARVRYSTHETDHFFGRLEARAEKARNLFLLTKAFTHWARSAGDEVQRTSVARRHILRTRFFKGWRDITAVNELKIQHFVLTKFLQQWRMRTATVRENARFAVALYNENLVQKVFTNWFFQFCAIAGSAWHNDRLKRNTLKRWIELAGVSTQKNELAINNSEKAVLAKMLASWKQRTATVRGLESQADKFRRTAQLTSGLYSLQKHARLKPLLQQFRTRINGRRVQIAFQTWRHTAELSQKARQVDKLRVIRNAYTAWNDRLRIQALEQRINDRILIECLYKWTLASRVSLFQRVHNRQIKESTFLTWATKTNQRANTLEAAERRLANFKRAQLLRTCLNKLQVDAAEKRREECAVIAEYDLKLKQRVFDKLKERLEHFQRLNQWSADARFYVLGTRTLKKWNSATQQTRRNRRRDTYSQVRRTVKSNLVRKVFESWRARADLIAQQNEQAAFLLRNRTSHTVGTLLHGWHDRTLAIQQLDTQASNVYTFNLGTKHLQAWTQRLDTLQSMDSQATALRQESAEIAAAGALKKLGWRLWNVQRQEETARALFERSFEKHVRAMIRFWHDQTAERLANRPVSPTPTRGSRGGRQSPDDSHSRFIDGDGNIGPVDLDNAGEDTRRLEAWTAFDASALGLNDDIDLSLSITPEHQRTTTYPLPPSGASLKPPSSARPPTLRPRTFTQPASALHPPPTLEPASPDLEFAEDERSTFWAGTPAYPPPTTSKPLKGAGYLKTPSKRAVVRAKRPELPSSPEKRVARLGAMSAPPAQMNREFGSMDGAGSGAVGGVTSFQRRLREGGFGASVGPAAVMNSAMKGARGRAARGRGRVGFGDVSQFG